VLERLRPEVERPPETFEDFYRREYTPVVGLAYALSGSRSSAEDLAQEAFFAAHRNWEKIASYDQPGAWVRRVVANLSVSAFRRRVTEAKAIARARPSVSATNFRTLDRVTLSSGEPCGHCPAVKHRSSRSSTSMIARSRRSPRSSRCRRER
jgi:DNA-directed RNA polymerase specialized sigma24 family protein